MAMVAIIPVQMSTMATPSFMGSPSGSPVIAINPVSAWRMKSYPGRPALGPVDP